jgi:hypothetical protein
VPPLATESEIFAIERRPAQLRLATPAEHHVSVRAPRYTREDIVARIQQWTSTHGQPPTIRDWDPSRAQRSGEAWRAERFATGDWPSVGMVRRQFGTFNAAVQAAGLTPRQGPRRVKRHLAGPEQVLDAIVQWTRRYGEPPTQADWDPVRARRLGQQWRIARYTEGDWPSLNTVLNRFGSLGEAVRAAGLQPRSAGEHGPLGGERCVANLMAAAQAMPVAHRQAGAPALARQITAVAAAKRSGDQERLRIALLDVAAVAVRWASDVAWTEE